MATGCRRRWVRESSLDVSPATDHSKQLCAGLPTPHGPDRRSPPLPKAKSVFQRRQNRYYATVIIRQPIRNLLGIIMPRMLILLCCLSTPLFAIQAAGGADAGKPNVLFLFTDDPRADTIAALGNKHIQTPNLDELVRSGFVFHNAYCMGSTMPAVCNPSRHMMHSGMSLFRYDPKQIQGTFGETMKRAGYYTYHESKRGNTPHTYHTAYDKSRYLNDQAERTSGHHGRTAAVHAVKFLKDYDRDQPFFMYIGFAGPHDPRVAAEEWKSLYDPAGLPLPGNYKPVHPFDNGEMVIRDEQLAPWPRTEEVVREHLHDYYACISSIDHNIGRIIAALKETGQFENTIIVFSSDHGLAVGSHGLFGKQSLYEHSMNSPLIFSGPRIPHGESDALCYLFDIFPTVCDLVGAPIPEGIDGKSLVPVIEGKAEGVRDTLFFAYRDVMRAVRQGDWKLIRYPQVNVTQLFNLREDPLELNNLSVSNPEQADRMIELLIKQQDAYDDKQPLVVENPQPAAITVEMINKAAEQAATKKRKAKRRK